MTVQLRISDPVLFISTMVTSNIRAEIQRHFEVIEQQRIGPVSEAAKRWSHVSRKSKIESLESEVGSVSSVKSQKFLLQKEEAALKSKLAFVEEEKNKDGTKESWTDAVASPAHQSPVHTPVQSKESHPTCGPANVKREEYSAPSPYVTPPSTLNLSLPYNRQLAFMRWNQL